MRMVAKGMVAKEMMPKVAVDGVMRMMAVEEVMRMVARGVHRSSWFGFGLNPKPTRSCRVVGRRTRRRP